MCVFALQQDVSVVATLLLSHNQKFRQMVLMMVVIFTASEGSLQKGNKVCDETFFQLCDSFKTKRFYNLREQHVKTPLCCTAESKNPD